MWGFMKRSTYYCGNKARNTKYGIWNATRKCWQFGVCEDTPMLAEARLFQKIGDDARKYRFEARELPAKWKIVSNFEKISAPLRTVRGFAEYLIETGTDDQYCYCKELPECEVLLETDEGIPDGRCQKCLEEWLEKEAYSNAE